MWSSAMSLPLPLFQGSNRVSAAAAASTRTSTRSDAHCRGRSPTDSNARRSAEGHLVKSSGHYRSTSLAHPPSKGFISIIADMLCQSLSRRSSKVKTANNPPLPNVGKTVSQQQKARRPCLPEQVPHRCVQAAAKDVTNTAYLTPRRKLPDRHAKIQPCPEASLCAASGPQNDCSGFGVQRLSSELCIHSDLIDIFLLAKDSGSIVEVDNDSTPLHSPRREECHAKGAN